MIKVLMKQTEMLNDENIDNKYQQRKVIKKEKERKKQRNLQDATNHVVANLHMPNY
jgi:hypothetical protein